MKRILLGLALLFCASSVLAQDELRTPAGNLLKWDLPVGWTKAATPPTELLKEIAEHLGHEAVRQQKNPTQEQLIQLAQKRMAANELLLYHPDSGSWISFDFSPLRQGEDPPNLESLELSARYALESLESEEGIRNLSSNQRSAAIASAPGTRRLAAVYRQHSIDTAFDGLIGYIPGEWFFIYATSYPGKGDVKNQINKLFTSLRFNL